MFLQVSLKIIDRFGEYILCFAISVGTSWLLIDFGVSGQGS